MLADLHLGHSCTSNTPSVQLVILVRIMRERCALFHARICDLCRPGPPGSWAHSLELSLRDTASDALRWRSMFVLVPNTATSREIRGVRS